MRHSTLLTSSRFLDMDISTYNSIHIKILIRSQQQQNKMYVPTNLYTYTHTHAGTVNCEIEESNMLGS